MTEPAHREELHVPKNAVIFRQGDPGNEMFVIASGRIRLTIGTEGHEKEVALLGPGEFFGELSLLEGAPRSATAQAAEDSTLLAISRDVFAMMVQDDLDIVFRMLNIQGRRLTQTNQPIQELTQRLGTLRVAAHTLRRVFAANSTLPHAVDLEELSAQASLSPQAIQAVVAELVQSGVGSLQNGRWTIETRAHVEKLLDALCRYADPAGQAASN
jgi:CRP-like cAMP-binding protein